MTDENLPRADIDEAASSGSASDAVFDGVDPRSAGGASAPADPSVCALCKEATVDRSENEESVLCADCREKAIRRKVPVWIWIFLAAIVALAAVAFTRFPSVMKDYKIYKGIDARLENGGIADAYADLYELSERYPDSDKLPMKLMEMCCDYGYFDVAAYFYDEYFAGETSGERDYKRINDCYLRINRYYTTVDAFEAIADEVYGGAGDLTEEAEALRCIGEIKSRLTALVGDPYQDTALLWMYISYLSADQAEAAECYRKSIEAEPIYIDAFTGLGTYHRRQGDIAGARQYYEDAQRLDMYDAGAARGMAVLSLLEGQLEQGLEQARTVYELYPDEPYALDTCAVALIANGRAAEADELVSGAVAQGYMLDEEFYAFRDGEISLQDYYVDKEA